MANTRTVITLIAAGTIGLTGGAATLARVGTPDRAVSGLAAAPVDAAAPAHGGIDAAQSAAGTDPAIVVIGGDDGYDVTPVPTGAPAPDSTVIIGGDDGYNVTPVPTGAPAPDGTVPTGTPAPDGTAIIGGDSSGTTVNVPVDPGLTATGMGLGAGTPNGYVPPAPVNDPDPIPTDYP
jgi:hypothetical protein